MWLHIKNIKGNGKTFLQDYHCYLKWKRLSYKHLKQIYKDVTFDEFMGFIDYLIEHKKSI